MKKLKYLFVVFVAFLAMPFMVFADDTEATPTPTPAETEETPSKVNVYLFRGEGCPHCEEMLEFFDSIEEEFGQYYTMNTYEVWYNQDNAELMQDVADKLGVSVTGVPFLVIGDQTWNGYASSYDAEIEAKILSEYNSDSRYDVMTAEEPKANNVAAVLIVVAVVGVIGGIVYVLRASTGDTVEDTEEENRSESKKQPLVVDEDEDDVEEEKEGEVEPKKQTKKNTKSASKKSDKVEVTEESTKEAKKTTKSSNKKSGKKSTKSSGKKSKTTSKKK